MARRRKAYRIIWENHNKACLLPGIHVHHIDGNHQNNDPTNLMACTAAEHWKFHFDRGDSVAVNGMFVQSAAKFGDKNPMYKHGLRRKTSIHHCIDCGNLRSYYKSPRCNKCKNSGGLNPKSKKVMCTKTGQTWNCIKDAAIDLGIKQSTLRAWLNPNNPNPNKTTLRYT